MSRPNARLRLAFGVTFAAVAAVFGAAPALAASAATTPATAPVAGPATTTDALTPIVDCVQDAPLGAVTARTVVLGYRSAASIPVAVQPGSGSNDLTAGAADRGQPSSFEPGEHHGVWLLTLDAAAEPGTAWRLGSTEVRFDAAPACTAATTVTVAAPASAQAGGTIAVTASIARMLLGAPGAGAVAFTIDGAAPVRAAVSDGVARADLTVTDAGPHTISATFEPADGSGLLPVTGTAAFTATAPSAPLSIAADSVVAGSTSVLVTVSRPAAIGVATVELMTADGTAKAGADYVAASRTLTFAEGQSSASITVPLVSRQAGSPSAAFFVLLQRSSAPVAVASASVTLPAVPKGAAFAADAGAAGVGGAGMGGGTGSGPSSVLPQSDPTASATTPLTGGGQELGMMLGGILITGGGIAGVIGLVRAAGMRGAHV